MSEKRGDSAIRRHCEILRDFEKKRVVACT